jgi:hypothetical protein
VRTYSEQQRGTEILGLCAVGADEGALDDALVPVQRLQDRVDEARAGVRHGERGGALGGGEAWPRSE